MRLVPILSAVLILASIPAFADNRSQRPSAAVKLLMQTSAMQTAANSSGIWEEDFTDKAGREWRRTFWSNGDWREQWTDGYCRIERGQKNGRFGETVSC